MKKTYITLLPLLPVFLFSSNACFATVSDASAANASVSNASVAEKVSYAIGYEVAKQIPAGIDSNSFIQGLREAQAAKNPRYSEQELELAYAQFQKDLEIQQGIDAKAAEQVNQKFFQDNAKKSGVISTKSGLQYKITTRGKGKKPTATSTVMVHYQGRLLNGKVFDSSFERGEAVEFPLNQVIPGWTEAMQLLNEGSKATLYVPAKLAYAEQGVPGSIPANSALIFDVELIKVK